MHEMEWSVLLELSAPHRAPDLDVYDRRLHQLLDLLAEYGAVVGLEQNGRRFSVRLTVESTGDVQAVLLEALGVVKSARRKVRLSSWPVTRVGDIVQADELAREVSEPNFPDFV
jgi:hypothetical protein